VNPEGRTVTYHFQYGSTASYGATTPEQTVGPDSDSHSVAADIANLQPSSTYHYRLVVDNGQAVGGDRQLTTTAAQFGAPSVALVGKPHQVDGQGTSAGKVTFDIQVTSDTPGTVVVQLKLADGTGSPVTSDPVTFAAGTSVVSAQMAIGTLGDGTLVQLTNVTATTADLTWEVETAGAGLAAQLEYGITKAYGRTASATMSSRTLSVHIDQLAPGTLYHARLEASDFDGINAPGISCSSPRRLRRRRAPAT
jgi:phosphodiesterase/alkaline phosphatase D-like protein